MKESRHQPQQNRAHTKRGLASSILAAVVTVIAAALSATSVSARIGNSGCIPRLAKSLAAAILSLLAIAIGPTGSAVASGVIVRVMTQNMYVGADFRRSRPPPHRRSSSRP
jgi:hypothetical protein